MIAHIRPPEPRTSKPNRKMRLAHRAVAESLLPAAESRPVVTPVIGRKAALLVAWMAAVAVYYVARMTGLWD
jgi:hypothetical protein